MPPPKRRGFSSDEESDDEVWAFCLLYFDRILYYSLQNTDVKLVLTACYPTSQDRQTVSEKGEKEGTAEEIAKTKAFARGILYFFQT